MEYLQLIAGSVSSLIFITGTLNMVVKAWLTKDMGSYSLSALVLNNIGNLIYWIYVMSLPLGPIYLLHGFYTVTTVLLLVWALLYRHQPETANRVTSTARRITQTIELPRFTAQS